MNLYKVWINSCLNAEMRLIARHRRTCLRCSSIEYFGQVYGASNLSPIYQRCKKLRPVSRVGFGPIGKSDDKNFGHRFWINTTTTSWPNSLSLYWHDWLHGVRNHKSCAKFIIYRTELLALVHTDNLISYSFSVVCTIDQSIRAYTAPILFDAHIRMLVQEKFNRLVIEIYKFLPPKRSYAVLISPGLGIKLETSSFTVVEVLNPENWTR